MRGCRILDRVGCYLVGCCYWGCGFGILLAEHATCARPINRKCVNLTQRFIRIVDFCNVKASTVSFPGRYPRAPLVSRVVRPNLYSEWDFGYAGLRASTEVIGTTIFSNC